MWLQKIFNFIKSKTFILIMLFIALVVMSLSFWFWGPLIAFNEVYIFGSGYLRFGIILIVWVIIFFSFLMKPIINFFASLKSKKRLKLKEFKKEANEFLFRAKRNFSISLQDAKNTWKKDIKMKNLPLFIIIGNEGAGKSTFINYSNIEYPLSDSLESYKKLHKSTTNFALYVSKKGALLDTEGNYFSQEDFFNPSNSDELPEDDLEKNKDFLIKKNIWQNFLTFLNKNFFHSKLNGIILVIDTTSFLNNPKEYSQSLIRHLTKRVNDCEHFLNLKLPIYIVFSKLDLIEGMKEYFDIFNDKIANKILGISFQDKINENNLYKEFQEISESLQLSFMQKNSNIYSLEEKNRIYLFLKQLDNLFALVVKFIIEMQQENALKNNSYIRGVYFVSAYQENIPRNFLLDAVCDKYALKKSLAKVKPLYSKQSYFVKSLLEDIIFKDYSLSKTKGLLKKTALLSTILIISLCTYFVSFYLINKTNLEVSKSVTTSKALESLLDGLHYEELTIKEKADLLAGMKNILSVYPELAQNQHIMQYFSLNLSYKGFKKAREIYQMLNEDVLKNTLLKEMETILQTDNDKNNLIKTLYIYQSLFEQKYLNKELLKIWINENWGFLEKYQITKGDFLSGIDELKEIDVQNFAIDEESIEIGINKLTTVSRVQRIYILFNFLNSDKPKEKYFIKEELGFLANNVFSEKSKINFVDKIYTKQGMSSFLKELNQQIGNVIHIEEWMLRGGISKESESVITLGILKLYLAEYQQKWLEILASISPQKYNTKSSMINELEILSKKGNPILLLIGIVSANTNLNDASLLSEAYSLGLNATEIKSNFISITNAFEPYHIIAKENSFLMTGAAAVGINSSDNEKIMETINANISNMQNKIVNFSADNMQNTEEKIAYSLGKIKEVDDPFVVFANNIRKLPKDLERYYNELSQYAWNLIESYGVSLFNRAWINEIYTPFINNITPYYPFNKESTSELSLDSFKQFFGKNGSLNNFYKKYLSDVLLRKKDHYVVNAELSTKLSFSKEFLDFYTKAMSLSYLMLNDNDNIKVIFTLHSLDLSADFAYIELKYQDKTMRYDHTLNSNLQIVGEQFINGASLVLTAYNYHNPDVIHNKTYEGEWGWYKFIMDSSRNNNGYSIIFNGNKKLYFDFSIINGAKNLNQIITILDDFKIVENITRN